MIGSKGIIIEIGASEVRGVLYTSFLGNPRIEKTESVSIENNQKTFAVDRLLSLFPSDAAITLQLPGHLFIVRTVVLPFTDKRKIRKILPFEMEGLLPIPVDELLLDSVHSSSTEKGSRVMALAIPKKTVADYTSLFPENRKPVRIIPDFLSLTSLGKKIKETHKRYGILNFDKTTTSIIIISDGRPVLMRATSPSGDKELVREWVTSTIKYDGQTVEKVYVTGRPPIALEGMAEFTPLPPIVTGISQENQAEWSAIAGGALTAAEFPWFNILGLSSESERTEKLFRSISIGIAILVALGTGDLYLRYRVASQSLSALKAETKKVFLSLMPDVRKVVKEDAQLKDAMIKGKELREALVGKPSPSYLAAMKGIERIAGEHPELKVKEVVLEGHSVVISGDGSGITADGVKKIFSGIEGVKEALVEEMAQGINLNSYRFRVKVELR